MSGGQQNLESLLQGCPRVAWSAQLLVVARQDRRVGGYLPALVGIGRVQPQQQKAIVEGALHEFGRVTDAKALVGRRGAQQVQRRAGLKGDDMARAPREDGVAQPHALI